MPFESEPELQTLNVTVLLRSQVWMIHMRTCFPVSMCYLTLGMHLFNAFDLLSVLRGLMQDCLLDASLDRGNL